MFSLFNKRIAPEKRVPNGGNDFYKTSFSKEQKVSTIMILKLAAICDGQITANESSVINQAGHLLGLDPNDNFLKDTKFTKKEYIIKQLSTFNSQQKRWFIGTLHSIICANGKPKDIEVEVVLRICKDIGISETECLETIQKIQSLTNQLEKINSEENKPPGFDKMFSLEQKAALITSLRLIATCDAAMNKKEADFIEFVCKTIGIQPFAPVFEENALKNKDVLIDILSHLQKPLKIWCVIMTHSLVQADTPPTNEDELNFVLDFWGKIGIPMEEYLEIVEKAST